MRHRSLVAATCAAALALIAHAAQADASLVHQFNLDNSFADSVGNLTITGDGGTLDAGGGYSFGQNQGLTLTNGFTAFEDNYTIVMDVQYSDLTSRTFWRKLIDFKDKTSDAGMYYYNGTENFYPVSSSADQTTANHLDRVALTRDGATGQVTAYLNGVQELTFTDTSGYAIFDTGANIVHFAEDDNITSQREDDAGSIRGISIFDGVASLNQINSVAPVPEASTTIGFALMMLMGIGGFMIRSRKSAKSVA